MEYINTRPLTFIVHRIQHSSRVLTVFNEINQSCHLNLKFELPENVLAMAKRINEREVHQKKYKPALDKNNNISWVFGEFKIFIWAIVYKCLIHGLQIQELPLEIAKELQNIFKSKSLPFIQYELQLLISQKYEVINENWEEEEIAIFTGIMQEATSRDEVNWRSISFELFLRSDARFFRNINHCREKWFNHLNPYVKKGDWTPEEDILIFTLIKEHGFKWSAISKAMGKTRTEHMVKNRFYKYSRQWKLPKDVTKEHVLTLFRDKIEAPYYKKRKNSKSTEQKDTVKKEEINQKLIIEEQCSHHCNLFVDINNSVDLRGEAKVEANDPQICHLQPSNDSHAQALPQKENAYEPIKDEADLKQPPYQLITINEGAASDSKVKVEADNQRQQTDSRDGPVLDQWRKDYYYPFMNMYFPPQHFAYHF